MNEFSVHKTKISATKMLGMIKNFCTEREILASAISDKMISGKKVWVLYIEFWENK